LSLGGSERMAVSMANAFSNAGHESCLLVTRSEGVLKAKLNDNVRYWFIRKKSAIDLFSFLRFVRIIKSIKPDIVHAHSTSIFWCMMVKLLSPQIKVVWHHHLGLSNLVKAKPRPLIVFLSKWFYGAVMVNERLFGWASLELRCDRSKICYLENFSDMEIVVRNRQEMIEGGLRILHLANFRDQKDHYNLLNSLLILKEKFIQFKAYLVGAHIDHSIHKGVLEFITKNHLENLVEVTGPSDNIVEYATKCNVGVLSSYSEGYPVSLLEYGSLGLIVLTTNAGQCDSILKNGRYGYVVPVRDPMAFADALNLISGDFSSAFEKSVLFQNNIASKNRAKQFVDEYITVFGQN
jgi:glycosyltransferase involved in cell wall biosynthesis